MQRVNERPHEQLRRQYEVERELADRLRKSNREQRRRLYGACYDQLFRRVPDHSMLTKKVETDPSTQYRRELTLLRRHVGSGTRLLELGAGDCKLAIEMARIAGHVYAVDVSESIVRGAGAPDNFDLILSDGLSIPLPSQSVDVILSNQLMEHIHPDDVAIHLEEARRVLTPGGRFVCLTPHRFSGPHDISRHFDEVATGFHLHEYTIRELADALRTAGFRRVSPVAEARGHAVSLPLEAVLTLERVVGELPRGLRRALCRRRGLSILFERLILVALA
jgi:ubiquinone/menaquinone biosynthesis C-methylase UbiE